MDVIKCANAKTNKKILTEAVKKLDSNFELVVMDNELCLYKRSADDKFDVEVSGTILRMTKTKMKVSGQFLNEETASEFAKVRTYTETCKRNGVDEFEALYRMMSGNPYTLAEIIEKEKS